MIVAMTQIVVLVLVVMLVRICSRNLRAALQEEAREHEERRWYDILRVDPEEDGDDRETHRNEDAAAAAREAAKQRHPSSRAKRLADLAMPGVVTPTEERGRMLTEDDPEWIEYSRRIEKPPNG